MVILKTYQHRAYTSKAGYERIAEVLRESARLYNAALEEWRWAYRTDVSVSLYSQYRELTAIRAGDPFWGGMSVQVGRGVLRRADRARQAFFRRASNGETPGLSALQVRAALAHHRACQCRCLYAQAAWRLLRHPH